MNQENAIPADYGHLEARLKLAQVRQHYKESVYSYVIMGSFLGFWLGLWELIHITGLIKPIFISDPKSVILSLVAMLDNRSTWISIWSSFIASIIGLLSGSALGIISGLILAKNKLLHRGLRPFLTLFNAFPRPALAPIFILWFGLGILPKIGIAITIVFFVLLYNTMAGISAVDPDRQYLAKTLRMNTWQIFRFLEWPTALPAIVAGLRLGAVYSVLGVIVSEMVAAENGLGQLLVSYTNRFAVSESFAVLIIMAALALTLDFCVSILQKKAHANID